MDISKDIYDEQQNNNVFKTTKQYQRVYKTKNKTKNKKTVPYVLVGNRGVEVKKSWSLYAMHKQTRDKLSILFCM